MNRPWFWPPAILCVVSTCCTIFAAAHGYPSWGGFFIAAFSLAVAAWAAPG